MLSIKRLIIYVCPHLLDKTVDSPWAGRVVVCFAWSTQGRLWKAVGACGCCYSLVSYINRYLILNFNFKIFFSTCCLPCCLVSSRVFKKKVHELEKASLCFMDVSYMSKAKILVALLAIG